MTDLRKAANMALRALEFSYPLIEDYGNKEQLDIHHEAIMALHKALTQPEQESPHSAKGSADSAEGFGKPEQEPCKCIDQFWCATYDRCKKND